MKQIIARLYIIIIVLLILLGLGYFSAEVIRSRNEYKKESQSVAEEVKLLIEKNWFKHKNFSSQSLNDQLSDMMSSDKDLNAIVIYSAEEGLKVLSSRYSDRSFLLNSFNPDDPNWNKEPEYSFGFFQKIDNYVVRKPLQITEKGYAFDVVYNILPKDKMLELLEYALKITAVFLVLTVIVIILFGLWKSKYTVKEYDDELFKPMGGSDEGYQGEPEEYTPEPAAGIDESLDSFDELEDLDDFETGIGEEPQEELDEFDLGTEDFGEDLEDLDDLSLETDESEEKPEEMDDFSLDFEEEVSETGDDFSIDFEEPEEIADEHAVTDENLEDFDVESGELVDDLEDFDLEIDSEHVSEDFDLEIEEESVSEETLDELDSEDFDLEIEEESVSEETLDELDSEDFDLEIEEESVSEETLDELDSEDFDLEIEDESTSEETLDELDSEDFDLEIEDESASEETFDELDSEHVSEAFDLGEEEESASEEPFDELEDFDLGAPESSELPLDADDFELIEDFDDMDLSPEVIEASTDINDLPGMEIEEEILAPKSDFKQGEEVAPEMSSLLEKAGVAGKDMSVAVLNLKGMDLTRHYDLINNHFEGNANIFELKSDQIAVALSEFDSNTAISEINNLIEKAKSQGLEIIAGISSMSGRRVGENRLMGEAVTAADKAQEQSKELLAFKPDPKKYNDFIINS